MHSSRWLILLYTLYDNMNERAGTEIPHRCTSCSVAFQDTVCMLCSLGCIEKATLQWLYAIIFSRKTIRHIFCTKMHCGVLEHVGDNYTLHASESACPLDSIFGLVSQRWLMQNSSTFSCCL